MTLQVISDLPKSSESRLRVNSKENKWRELEVVDTDQSCSNFHMYRSAGYIVETDFGFSIIGWNLEFSFSNNILSDADIAGPRATLNNVDIESFFIEVCYKRRQISGVL